MKYFLFYKKLMGNSNDEQKKLLNNTYQVLNNMSIKKKNIEKNFLEEEITKRGGNQEKVKFILNIYIYSNDNINDELLKPFKMYNSSAFDWKIKLKLIGFSGKNNEKLIEKCNKDFADKKFAIVVVIPIKSITNFKTLIEQNEKDILAPFNDLNEEQQPFFLFIDEEEKDFICTKTTISLNSNKDYFNFMEKLNKYLLFYNSKDEDFQM